MVTIHKELSELAILLFSLQFDITVCFACIQTVSTLVVLHLQLAQPHNPPNNQPITRSPTTLVSDVNSGPAQSEENPVMVHNHGTQMHGGLPVQESGDGEMLYPPPAQVGSNANIMVHDPFPGSANSEDELGGVIIAVQLLVMSVDTTPAIVAEL